MRSFFQRSERARLAHELRHSRPEPPTEFVDALSDRIQAEAPHAARSGLRIALAGALTALPLVALAAFGGIGYAASSAKHAAKAVERIVSPNTHTASRPSAGADQYVGKITICHRTGSAKNPTVTITISRSALPAHLRHGDLPFPCP